MSAAVVMSFAVLSALAVLVASCDAMHVHQIPTIPVANSNVATGIASVAPADSRPWNLVDEKKRLRTLGCSLLQRRLRGGAGWGGGGAAGKEFVLRTPCHDHLSYYGVMFDVTAKERDLTITGIAMAATTPKSGPYLYTVFAANEPCDTIKEREACWVRVGEGRVTLPCKIGQYGQLPLQTPITVRRGTTVGVYVHSPECAEGVAYRNARLTGPEGVTDQDDNLQIQTAYPSFALTPFEDVQDSPRAIAGIVRYKVAADSEL